MTRLGSLLAISGLLAVGIHTSTAAAAAPRRASLTEIENDVMCVACHESLAVAQSPEAYSERAYIRGLINQGLDKQQIESQLVAQYGPSVLGRPPAHGFNLTVYILPPAILLLGLGILGVTLPRWRQRTRDRASLAPDGASAASLDPADARRLEEELSRFPG